MSIVNEKRMLALQQRKDRLQLDPVLIPAVLHAHVFGDYLDANRQRPKTLKRSVTQAYMKAEKAVLQIHALKRLRPLKTWGDLATEWSFENQGRNLQSVLETTDLFIEVLQLHHRDISSFLERTGRRAFVSAFPTVAKLRSLARLEVHDKVLNALHSAGFGDQTILTLPQRRGAEYTIMKGIRACNYSVEAGVSALIEFLHQKSMEPVRREELSDELNKWGLALRSDSKLCQNFITGACDRGVQEVVALMFGTAYLFNMGGHILWSRNHHEMDERIQRTFHTQNITWRQATDQVINSLAEWVDDVHNDDFEYHGYE